MELYKAQNFEEVQAYVKKQINLFSCFSYTGDKFGSMRNDFSEYDVEYLLIDDLSKQGYIRVLNLDMDQNEKFEEYRIGLVDIIVPRNLSEDFEDLKNYASEIRGYDKLFLNCDVQWIKEELPYVEIEVHNLIVPDLEVRKHFESGNGQYNNLVDLISHKF